MCTHGMGGIGAGKRKKNTASLCKYLIARNTLPPLCRFKLRLKASLLVYEKSFA